MRGLFSSCGERGPFSSSGVRASPCGGFSCCGAQALGCVGFISCDSRAAGHRLNGSGVQA